MPRTAANGHAKPAPPPPPVEPVAAPAASPPTNRPARRTRGAKPDPAAALAGALTVVTDVVQAVLPPGASTQEEAAAQYWGASVVARYAESWRERAKKAAVSAGVLPSQVYPVGTSETVYAGTLLTVSLKVVEQASKVDVAGLMADLEGLGVKPATLKRLIVKHTRAFPGAQIFTATLVA